jgi:diguanylate cyclase
MPRSKHFQRPPQGAPPLGFVWPTAILFVLTLGLAFATLLESDDGVLHRHLVGVVLLGAAVASLLVLVLVFYIRRLSRELAQSQERAHNLFGRDPLSSLPNRLLFSERLDTELHRLGRMEGGIAVLFLDLDRFKDVNDTHGHQAGDELIKQVAQRLGDLLRGADTLARFGGDEFAIIQTGIRSSQDAEALARRILDAVGLPFEIGDARVSVGVSIGIALAPENGTSHEILMRLADTALYQAKSEGRNRFSFFERTMDEALRMRKIVEDDLRHAIIRDELTLHYQPVFSADGRTVVAVEALVRWPHSQQGLISPKSFISIAEERGLVVPLGEWVLRRACMDGKRWPGVRIAVNVSPIQFRQRDFVASVVRTLRDAQFDPTLLELELTEGVVVEDADAAEAAMMELRALGVNLALDDFGTGYSSLIYLRRFAFDKIKIDRSFLESMEATGESAILVHSIVHLGRALGLTVTAEGVETKEQHRFLQALGCHQLQGFLFSKPVPPEEIDRLLGIEAEAPAELQRAKG